MISIKTSEEILRLREGGKILASVLRSVSERVKPGATTRELDSYAEKLLRENGVRGSFKKYTLPHTNMPYPTSLCVSVNDEVVHGIASERVLIAGDVLTLDVGVEHEGFFTDGAITVAVGGVSHEVAKLIAVTKQALAEGIAKVKAGAHMGDVGSAIQKHIEDNGFTVVKGLIGHGVGYGVHEEPDVPNTGKTNAGLELKEGMILAIEPMATTGKGAIVCDKTGWVWSTRDGAPSAHFEHTVAVTKNGAEVLTQ